MAEIINSVLTGKESPSNIGNKIFYFIYYTTVIGVLFILFFVVAIFLTNSSEGLGIAIFSSLFFFLPPLLTLIASIIIYRDAKKLKNQGANIENPSFWAVTAFISIGIPVYLAFRKVDYKKQIKDKINSGQAQISNLPV